MVRQHSERSATRRQAASAAGGGGAGLPPSGPAAVNADPQGSGAGAAPVPSGRTEEGSSSPPAGSQFLLAR